MQFAAVKWGNYNSYQVPHLTKRRLKEREATLRLFTACRTRLWQASRSPAQPHPPAVLWAPLLPSFLFSFQCKHEMQKSDHLNDTAEIIPWSAAEMKSVEYLAERAAGISLYSKHSAKRSVYVGGLEQWGLPCNLTFSHKDKASTMKVYPPGLWHF